MPYVPYNTGPIEPADPRVVLAAFAILAIIVLAAVGASLWQNHHHRDDHRISHQH